MKLLLVAFLLLLVVFLVAFLCTMLFLVLILRISFFLRFCVFLFGLCEATSATYSPHPQHSSAEPRGSEGTQENAVDDMTERACYACIRPRNYFRASR